MPKKWVFVITIFAIVTIFIGYQFWSSQKSGVTETTSKSENTEYNPVFNPDNFVPQIDNPYFTLIPGATFRYEKKSGEGIERIEVEVLSETKQVMGVTTTVVWDKVFLNDELIEDTRDWYGQDKEGNVWYFGEEVDNYENGKLKDHAGAWEAGVDGALPGIIMPINPQVGFKYRQEYYMGVAEDWGEVVALDQEVTTAYGTFTDCLKVKEWSALDESTAEHKHYCSDVSFLVVKERPGRDEKVEFVSVSGLN